jgi:hypothetical protein
MAGGDEEADDAVEDEDWDAFNAARPASTTAATTTPTAGSFGVCFSLNMRICSLMAYFFPTSRQQDGKTSRSVVSGSGYNAR